MTPTTKKIPSSSFDVEKNVSIGLVQTCALDDVKKNLEENGIEIPFPQQVVYLHNVPGNYQIPEEPKCDQTKEIESGLNYEGRVLN